MTFCVSAPGLTVRALCTQQCQQGCPAWHRELHRLHLQNSPRGAHGTHQHPQAETLQNTAQHRAGVPSSTLLSSGKTWITSVFPGEQRPTSFPAREDGNHSAKLPQPQQWHHTEATWKLFPLNQQLQVKLLAPVPQVQSSPVFVGIHPTRFLPSACCSPIMYPLGFSLLYFHSRKSPSQFKHCLSCFSSSLSPEPGSFWVTNSFLPNLQQEPSGKVWGFFLPFGWAVRICNLNLINEDPNQEPEVSPDDSAEHSPPVMGNLKWAQANTATTKTTSHLFNHLFFFIPSLHYHLQNHTQNQTEEPASLSNNEEQTGKFLKWFRLLICPSLDIKSKRKDFSVAAWA